MFSSHFPAKQKEKQLTSAACPKKKYFLMDICTTPNAERNGLFWNTKEERPSAGVAWTNPGGMPLFPLLHELLSARAGENGTKTCDDPQLGEPIVGRAFKADTFELAPALLVVTNMLCSFVMMVFGIRAWSVGRATRFAEEEQRKGGQAISKASPVSSSWACD